MCVQGVDVQCVLQFTLIHAAGCALHRRTSRVIHRIELSMFEQVSTARATRAEGLRSDSQRLDSETCVQRRALPKRRPKSNCVFCQKNIPVSPCIAGRSSGPHRRGPDGRPGTPLRVPSPLPVCRACQRNGATTLGRWLRPVPLPGSRPPPFLAARRHL